MTEEGPVTDVEFSFVELSLHSQPPHLPAEPVIPEKVVRIYKESCNDQGVDLDLEEDEGFLE